MSAVRIMRAELVSYCCRWELIIVSLLQTSVIGFLLKCLQLVPPTQIFSVAFEKTYLMPGVGLDRLSPADRASLFFHNSKVSRRCLVWRTVCQKISERKCLKRSANQHSAKSKKTHKDEGHGRNAECFNL